MSLARPDWLRLLLVPVAATALALGGASAATADPIGDPHVDTNAGSPSNGTYTATVQLSGNGVGSGGDLAGPPVSSGGGGRVSVPSPCGYRQGPTQEEIEAANDGDQSRAENQVGQLENHSAGGGYPISIIFSRAQIAAWGQTGTWYQPYCDGLTLEQWVAYAQQNPPVLVPAGGAVPVAEAPADPEFLLDIAQRAMTLPDPQVNLSPATKTLVRLPTWVWVDPDQVNPPRVVTAAAGGVAVTVTATNTGSRFTASDGAEPVDCTGGGVAYQGVEGGSDCVLEFQESSGRAPGQQFEVTGTTFWSAQATGAVNRALPGAAMDSAPVGLQVLEAQIMVGGGFRWPVQPS